MKSTLTWNSNEIVRAINNALPGLLRDVGEMILNESNKIAPIDEGTMINTGSVSVNDNKVYISYDTAYAIKQHDDTGLTHKNGRQDHFLSKAVETNQKKALDYIADGLERSV